MRFNAASVRTFASAVALTCLTALSGATLLDTKGPQGAFSSGWTFGTYARQYGSASYSTSTSGGNPNDYLQAVLGFSSPLRTFSSRAIFTALNSSETWTPTSSFTHMKLYCDERQISPIDHHFALFIEQNGHYYIGLSPSSTLSPNTWVPGSQQMAASDFFEIDLTTGSPTFLDFFLSNHPNLTSGSTVTFGFCYVGDHAGSTMSDGTTDIDNWKVEIYGI